MSNLVNKFGNLAKPGNQGNPADAPGRAAEPLRIDAQQGKHAVDNVTQNLGRNPNFARNEEIGQDLPDDFTNNARKAKGNDDDIDQPDVKPKGRRDDDDGDDRRDIRQRGRGEDNASDRGLERGRGHHKKADRGEPNPLPKPAVEVDAETQPLPKPNNVQTGNGVENAAQQGLLNGKGLQKQNDPQTNLTHNYNGNGQEYDQPKPFVTVQQAINVKKDDDERQRNENRENNFTRQIIREILRNNDIHIKGGDLKDILNQGHGKPKAAPANQQLVELVQVIQSNIVPLTDGSIKLNGKAAHQIAAQLSIQLQDRILSVRNNILQSPNLEVKDFAHLNIKDRMLTGIDMIPKHLPTDFSNHFQRHHPQEVLFGMLLTRGLILGGENVGNLRDFVASQPAILPRDFSFTSMRNIGLLVKGLIADSAIAKSTPNLDLAVQKFVRILLANNELGVLLATIGLASQTRNSGGFVSRTLALAQIYELINRLILAGEKAMKQAAANLPKSISIEGEFAKLQIPISDDASEFSTTLRKSNATGAEAALRQFLEFNPALVMDRSVSAFADTENARQARQDFASIYQDDIDQWLRTGNHRLVKEIDLGKPIGVVIERNSSEVFTANTLRMVLVRDSSVQGWHFLKSVLVR